MKCIIIVEHYYAFDLSFLLINDMIFYCAITNDFICRIHHSVYFFYRNNIKFPGNYSHVSNHSTCQCYLLSKTFL